MVLVEEEREQRQSDWESVNFLAHFIHLKILCRATMCQAFCEDLGIRTAQQSCPFSFALEENSYLA